MSMLWPGFLAFMVFVPLLAAVYWRIQRRRRKVGLRYSSLALVRVALPQPSRLRKYLPPVLFLLALAGLVIALARPAIIYPYSQNLTTILLVIDVSNSMRFRDIPPTRLAAAQSAALSFVRSQKSNTQIGIVAFSTEAQLVQSPTTDQEQLEMAIRSLTLGGATAMGSGMLEALDVIAQVHNPDHPQAAPRSREDAQGPLPTMAAGAKATYAPEIIVLLTDGDNTTGLSPIKAAHQAAEQGVRVYTIGYGSVTDSSKSIYNPASLSSRTIPNTGGADDNQGAPLPGFSHYNNWTLTMISGLTGGKTYTASSAIELERIFASLPVHKTVKTESQEISVLFVAIGAFLAAAAMALAAVWQPLP